MSNGNIRTQTTCMKLNLTCIKWQHYSSGSWLGLGDDLKCPRMFAWFSVAIHIILKNDVKDYKLKKLKKR